MRVFKKVHCFCFFLSQMFVGYFCFASNNRCETLFKTNVVTSAQFSKEYINPAIQALRHHEFVDEYQKLALKVGNPTQRQFSDTGTNYEYRSVDQLRREYEFI